MKDTRKQGDRERKSARTDGKPARSGKPIKKRMLAGKPREKDPAHQTVVGEGERISKIMARAGVASRRDCERMVLAGRVSLNGTVLTTPAINCTVADKIEVDGKPISAIERTRLWIYYKPAGLVTTNHDPEGRPTVFDNLPADLPRVISVGRLDINTEGLLLLTNDGGLARMLELPTTGWLRRYRVRAHGAIDQEKLDSLKEGIAVDGIFYGSIEATLDREKGHNVWITMGLREGKNREIKNVLGALGLDVNRLIRISYGPFQLGELEDGQVVEVKSRTLREQLGPRLIEEANANFEAPINNQQKPKDEEEPEAGERPKRENRDDRPKREGREERPRRESREERRERDLARIDTKRPVQKARQDGDRRHAHDDDDRKPKRPPLGTSRTANVWMAPGARPVAQKKAKEETAAAEPKRRILRLKKDATSEAAPAGESKPKRAQRASGPKQAERSGRPERKERSAKWEGTKPEGNRPAKPKSAAATRSAEGEGGRFRGKPSSEGKPNRGKASAEGRPERGRPPRPGKPEGAKPPRTKPARPRPENTGSDRGSSGDRKDGGANRRR